MKADEFKQRFLRFSEMIFRYAFALLGDQEDAEDIVQEVYEKLWEIRNTLSSVENDEAFVVTITRNRALDRIREQSRQRTTSITPSIDPGDDGQMLNRLEAKERLKLINILLDTLPANQQTAIRLRHFVGHSFTEIADIMQLTEVNVRQLLSRGRRALKEKMKNHE